MNEENNSLARNWLMDPMELTLQSLSKDHQAVVKADDLKSRIAYWSDNEKFVRLGQKLYEWSRVIGVKEPILEDDMNLIVGTIKLEFSDFTEKEIDLAFRKGVTGKLKVDFEHYQSFNIMYVSKVLQAYREFRKEAMAARHKAQESTNRLLAQETTPKSREEKLRELHDGLDAICDRDKKLPLGWDWASVYNYLEETGKIKLSHEDKEIWRDNVIAMIEDEIEYIKEAKGDWKEARRVGKILETKEIHQNQKTYIVYSEELRIRCRVEYVKHYFRNKHGII